MPQKKLDSAFVRRRMPHATADEVEDATRRWFAFLRTLMEIADEEFQKRDSRESNANDRFGASPYNL